MNFSRGVEGSLSHLWKFGSGGVFVTLVEIWEWWGGGGGGGVRSEIPSMVGSGYFLELHVMTTTMIIIIIIFF